MLITLAGHRPSAELLRWRAEEADLSIAVDGGWLAHRHAGVQPDLVLGDFDSCGDLSDIQTTFPRSVLLEQSDQNYTDFEKALRWLLGRETPTKINILGGLGKRMDHALSNLIIAGRVNPEVEVVFDDEHEYVYRITPNIPLSLIGRAGMILTILPLGNCLGVQSSGLEWELDKINFSWEEMISQSNRCSSDEVKVTCESGVLYAFTCKDK